MHDTSLSVIDIVIIAVYLLGMVIYGVKKGKGASSEGYFLGGRSLTWPIIGISLFAANIGSNTLIGLSASAYQGNVAVYNYEWMAAVVLVFFAVFFLPFYLRSRVYTMPEFLQRRYDIRCRYLFSIVMIVGNVVIDMASGLYAGTLVLKLVFPGVDSWVIVLCLALSAALYTVPGGLASVVHTEVAQAFLLVLASCLITWLCFVEVGGWGGMMAGLSQMQQTGLITESPESMLSLIKPASDPAMPWTGLVLGVPLLGFYFWVNNQFMVQRVLSAKNIHHGQWGVLFAGALKLPVLFIMVIPGVVALVLFHSLDISSLGYYTMTANGERELCSRLNDCPNMTYPVLIYQLLPPGLFGFVIAGLLAAMASSIAATLNGASSLITMDFVSTAKPGMSSKALVRIGQLTTFILVLLAAIWTPQIERFSSLWQYLQHVLAYISPPIVAAFLTGLFSRRANADGAFVSMVSGYLIVFFFVGCQWIGVASTVTDLHFLLQVPILVALCVAINLVVSTVSANKTSLTVLENYTWQTAMFKQESKSLMAFPWYQNYRVLAAILLLMTASIVAIFW